MPESSRLHISPDTPGASRPASVVASPPLSTPPLISSLQNPTIKAIRKLEQRKYRDQAQRALVDSARGVALAVECDAHIERLVIAPDLVSPADEGLLTHPKLRTVPRLLVSEQVFRGISRKSNPKGMAAVISQRWTSLEGVELSRGLCWLALESVQDPGNLGTIIRTCDAVGAGGLILLDHATDPYHPTAIQASTGAVFTQRLVRATVDEFFRWKNRNSATVIGTSPRARRDYTKVDYPQPLVLVMGSESRGLSKAGQSICDELVKIPMAGRVESLNLAVATGLMLYQVFDRGRRRTDTSV